MSIDVALRCPGCGSEAEAWFILNCHDDLYSPSPEVSLQRFSENRRDMAGARGLGVDEVDDLFERAQIAYADGLGAGAMIYLRKIFEALTSQAADAIGVPMRRERGYRRSFKSLLQEVDARSQIIPPEFSAHGYRLFSELSEVIHGDGHELDALEKYEPCRRLIMGIVNNARNRAELASAVAALGWHERSGPPLEAEI